MPRSVSLHPYKADHLDVGHVRMTGRGSVSLNLASGEPFVCVEHGDLVWLEIGARGDGPVCNLHLPDDEAYLAPVIAEAVARARAERAAGAQEAA